VSGVGDAVVGMVGREVGVLHRFLEDDSPARALVLTGPPGVGKTTLWEAGISAARDRGLRVLSAPTRSRPCPLRSAPRWRALLRAEPTGARPGRTRSPSAF
jgi:hypothetical protein